MGSRLEGLQRLLIIINKLEGKKRYVPVKELKRKRIEAVCCRCHGFAWLFGSYFTHIAT